MRLQETSAGEMAIAKDFGWAQLDGRAIRGEIFGGLSIPDRIGMKSGMAGGG